MLKNRGGCHQRACSRFPPALSFIQHFGSSLQHNTHFHVLVPKGLFAAPSPETDERATFLPLPPPEDEEVESLLCTPRPIAPARDPPQARFADLSA